MQNIYFDPTGILDDLGIETPAGVQEANAAAEAVRAIAYDKPGDVMPWTTTAATVAHDMREHIIARELHKYAQQQSSQFERHATAQVRKLYTDEAPRILAELPKAAAKYVKLITEAAKHIGPDDTAETILERGKAAADTWRKRDDLNDAASTLNQITSVAVNLASLAGHRDVHEVPEPLWWVDVTDHNHLARVKAEEWSAVCPGRRFLALAHSGFTVALATPEQALARHAKVKAAADAQANAWQRKQQAAEAAHNRRVGRQWVDALTGGTGKPA